MRGHSFFTSSQSRSDVGANVARDESEAATAAGKIKLWHASMRGSAVATVRHRRHEQGRVSLEEAQQTAMAHFDAADINHDRVLSPEERPQAAAVRRAKRHAA